MSTTELVADRSINMTDIEALLVDGNLSRLTPEQRVRYYKATCDSLGLNPLTQPFSYITLSGKLVLYANKGAAEQLRKIHGVSIEITNCSVIDDCYVVQVLARAKDGRTDAATAVIPIKTGSNKLVGDALANTMMKCETKAKRRVTLSICGLNMLDETEVETIPNAQPARAPAIPGSSAADRLADKLGKDLGAVPSDDPAFDKAEPMLPVDDPRPADVAQPDPLTDPLRLRYLGAKIRDARIARGLEPAVVADIASRMAGKKLKSLAGLNVPQLESILAMVEGMGKAAKPAANTDEQTRLIADVCAAADANHLTQEQVEEEALVLFGMQVKKLGDLSVAQLQQLLKHIKEPPALAPVPF